LFHLLSLGLTLVYNGRREKKKRALVEVSVGYEAMIKEKEQNSKDMSRRFEWKRGARGRKQEAG